VKITHISFSSSSEKSVIPSSGLSASGRCEDAIFAAIVSLISKDFQENIRNSCQLSACSNLFLVKRSVEDECTRLRSYDQKRTSRVNGYMNIHAGPKPDGTI
jgi:hypothetical protein